MATVVGSCLRSSMQDCSAALRGPYCADPFGVPRYSATIWIDFLNGHVASSTRGNHWHGGTRSSGLTHVAVSEDRNGAPVQWLEYVTDAQFVGPEQPSSSNRR